MKFSEAVGAMVRAIRGGMTQTELGEAAGVSQSTVSAIEVGNRDFSAWHLEAILAATNTSGIAAIKILLARAEDLQRQPEIAPRQDAAVSVPQAKRLADAEEKVQRARAAEAGSAEKTKRARIQRKQH